MVEIERVVPGQPGWLTGRQAERRLSEVGLGPDQARRALAAGFAGESRRKGRGTLYRRSEVEQVAPGWDLGLWLPALLRAYRAGGMELGCLVVAAGLVARGFDLEAALRDGESGKSRLVLAEPGEWFARLEETRLELTPGKHWFFLEPGRCRRFLTRSR